MSHRHPDLCIVGTKYLNSNGFGCLDDADNGVGDDDDDANDGDGDDPRVSGSTSVRRIADLW